MNNVIKLKTKDDVISFLNDTSKYDIVQIVVCDAKGYTKEGLEIIDTLTKNFDKVKDNLKEINLEIQYERIPKDVFGKFYDFNLWFKDYAKCNVVVGHYLDGRHYDNKKICWDLNTIIKANLEINNVCKFIKNSNFSPLETLAFIHRYVSTISTYRKSERVGQGWTDHDQFFAGAYKDLPEIVCMGYSALMKEIIDNLNIPGLKCEFVSVEFMNKKKNYLAKHAKCFLFVEDKKYGVNQTMFDDPTWDNTYKSLTKSSKYAHFAMDNNCHFADYNKLYYFYTPTFMYLNQSKSVKIISDDYVKESTYNKSENKIDQLMIETIHFNILQKEYPEKNINDIYNILKEMAFISYNEQKEREFMGNLEQEKLKLTKSQAKTIFDLNNKKNQDKFKLSNMEESM